MSDLVIQLKKKGQILIFSIIVMAIFFVFSIALLRFERTFDNTVYSHIYSEQAFYLALSGINYIRPRKTSCPVGDARFNLYKTTFGFDGYINTTISGCAQNVDRTSTGFYSPGYSGAPVKENEFSKSVQFQLRYL